MELGCHDANDKNIAGMRPDFKEGMAFALSNWSSGNLQWLQGNRCQGGCGNPTLNFSNLEFGTAAAPDEGDKDEDEKEDDEDQEDKEEDEDDEYDWGTQCVLIDDGLCGTDCGGECRWSWPKEDSLTCKSPDAACRCRTYDPIDYAFIRDCEGKCSQDCQSCRWSWPKGESVCSTDDGSCRCADGDADVFP